METYFRNSVQNEDLRVIKRLLHAGGELSSIVRACKLLHNRCFYTIPAKTQLSSSDIVLDRPPSGSSIPCGLKVHVPNLVVAPPAVDWGAEASVPGLLQGGEAVFEEPLEARLGGFQQGHVLKSAVNHRDAWMGTNSLDYTNPLELKYCSGSSGQSTCQLQINYAEKKIKKNSMWMKLLKILLTDSGHVVLVNSLNRA